MLRLSQLLLSTQALIEENKFPGQDLPIVNNKPVIGILTQPLLTEDRESLSQYQSYIMKPYVSFLESAGARVVPIIFKGDQKKEFAKLQYLNGILFAGGSAGDEYFHWAKNIYEEVLRLNEKENQFYPIWGTFLGFEDLVMYQSSYQKASIEIEENHHEARELNLLQEREESALWSYFTEEEIEILQTKGVSYLSHSFGFSLESFLADIGIMSMFKPTAYQVSNSGSQFVAAIEARRFPFYALQFHPEKELWSFAEDYNIVHDEEISLLNRKYADFFVN